MRQVLYKIAHNYQTPEQLREGSEEQYGLEYQEALEMAYENIQAAARAALDRIQEETS